MRYFLLSFLIFASGFAETIQNVEYSLPKEAKDWIIGNKLESEKGTTIVYLPEGKRGEFFAINANYLASDVNDPAPIEVALTKIYPNLDIEFKVIDKVEDGIIYEWVALKDDKEGIHGWGRTFSTNEGTVVLGYQTENIAEIAKAFSIWFPVLKKAHLKPPKS